MVEKICGKGEFLACLC